MVFHCQGTCWCSAIGKQNFISCTIIFSMKLLYLYIRSFGIFRNDHPVEINFTGDYIFAVRDDPNGYCKVTVKKGDALPESFYSLGKLHVQESVSAISAIIGANGSGKSTIGTLLAVARGRSSRHYEILMIWEKGGLWNLYTTISNFDRYEGVQAISGGPKCEVVDELGALQGSFDYVFFSPHFEPDNAFEQEFDSSACYNISTSALFFTRPDKVLNKDLSRRDSVSFIRRAYELEQNLWIGRFIHTMKKWRVHDKNLIELPKSMFLSVYSDNDATEVSKEHLLERLRNETLSFDESERQNADVMHKLRGRLVDIHSRLNGGGGNFASRFLVNFIISYWRTIESAQRDITGLSLFGKVLDCIEIFSKTEVGRGGERTLGVENAFSDMVGLLNEKAPALSKKFAAAAALLKILLRGRIVEEDGHYISRFSLCNDNVCAIPFLDEAKLADVFGLYEAASFMYDFLEFKYTPSMSAGELVMLRLFSRLYWYLNPPSRGGESAIHIPNKDVLIFFDEVETTLHPEWQRRIIMYLVWFFGKFAPKSKIHLILATHSPILLSDIPASNCVFLERVPDEEGRPYSRVRGDVINSQVDFNNTFMANIHDLYSLPFFLNNGCVGRFAEGKVEEALNPKLKIDEDARERVFSMIGDSIVRQVVKDTWRLKRSNRSKGVAKDANSAKA